MNFAWFDLIGSFGVAVIILTYILLQTEKIKSANLAYSMLNALGAGMIVFSLIYRFNFSAFIVESLWALISLYGVWKYFFAKK